jgi:hypothetical protein
MKTKKKFLPTVSLWLLALAVVSLPASATVKAQDRGEVRASPMRAVYTGTVVTFGGFNRSPTRTFTLEITGETPDSEVKKDFQILKSKGQDGFLKAIEKRRLGYFSVEGHAGQNINYVTETRTEAGRKIVVVFERWIAPFEVRYGSDSVNYPLTYIELLIDDNGEGAGSMIQAARVKADKKHKNMPDFENFGASPAKLIGVREEIGKMEAE